MNFVETPNQHPSVGVLTGVDFRAAASVNSEEASNGALSCEDLAARGQYLSSASLGVAGPHYVMDPKPSLQEDPERTF